MLTGKENFNAFMDLQKKLLEELVNIAACCLMSNHHHFLFQTPK